MRLDNPSGMCYNACTIGAMPPMRHVWLFIDGKPIGPILGKAKWRLVTELGVHHFTIKQSNKAFVIEWAKLRYPGLMFDTKMRNTDEWPVSRFGRVSNG